jgi:hypothetical protein
MTIETLGDCLANSSVAGSRGINGAVRSRAVLRRFSSTSVAGTCKSKKNIGKPIKKSGLFNFDGDAYILKTYPIVN